MVDLKEIVTEDTITYVVQIIQALVEKMEGFCRVKTCVSRQGEGALPGLCLSCLGGDLGEILDGSGTASLCGGEWLRWCVVSRWGG